MSDDLRQIPAFSDQLWSERISERSWHYCKYCERNTPTFILAEGRVGSVVADQHTRGCWECGSGLKLLGSINGGAGVF